MFTIKTSRYNKAIENELFSNIKQDYINNKRAYIIVPEQFTLDNEIKLMEVLDANTVMNIKIMSFNKMAIEALSNIGGIKRRYIDEIGKAMIIKRIFQENKENLLLYDSSSEKEGFIEAVIKLITELKRSMILPEDLLRTSEAQSHNLLFSQKLKEIALIYRAFEEKLKDKYVDNEDRIGQFSEIENLTYLRNTSIYIYSFFSFTELEYKVIKNMITSSLEVELYLNLDLDTLKDEDTFFTTNKTFERINQIAHQENCISKLEQIKYVAKNTDEIKYLGDNLFKLIPEKNNIVPKSVELYYAHNIDEEIKQVAMDISRKIIFENYRYKDILVVSTDSKVYNDDIKLIFKNYDIPCFIDEKRSVASSPISRVIISILNLLNQQFTTEDLLMFLKSNFNDLETKDIFCFENHILKRKLKSNMFFEDKYFLSEHYYENEEEKFSVEKIRNYIKDVFLKTRKINLEKNTAAYFAENIFELFIDIELPNKAQLFVETLKEKKFTDEANQNGQIWNLFLKILDQSTEIFNDELLEFKYYSDILIQALVNHKLSVVPPSRDQVVVADMERSRSTDKKIVYILGANNSGMPRLSKDNTLLSKEDKEYLEESGVNLPSNVETIDSREILLIYNIITKAETALKLSYASDTSGISVMPSIIINQIMHIYPKLKPKNKMDISAENLINIPKATISTMANEIKKYTKGENIDEIWLQLLAYYRKSEDYKELAQIALDGIFYENIQPKIKEEQAKALYSAPLRVSTTRIDSFIKCPFSHFIKYGIKAKERKIYNIEPAEMGQVLHLTIEKFIEHIKKELPSIESITKSQTDEIIKNIFEDSAQTTLKEYDLKEKRNQYILNKLNKTAKFVGFNCVQQIQKGKFELLYQEEKFGKDSEIPPIIININGQEIILEGIIDRVDIYKDEEKSYIKVIDYKTRNKPFSLSDAYNGLDIQLIIYLKAAMQSSAFIKTQTYPGGVFYFPIINPMISTDTRDPKKIEEMLKSQIKLDGIVLHDIKVMNAINGEEEDVIKAKGRSKDEHLLELNQFESLINRVQDNIYSALEEMISGIIEPTPIKSEKNQMTACDYCRYSSICKFDEDLDENSYRVIPSYKTEEVISMLEGENEDEQ